MGKYILGILASGGGTNFQSIIDHLDFGVLKNVEIGILICNKKDAYALERARRHGIERKFIDHRGKEREAFDRELMGILSDYGVDLVILAGWMRIVSPPFIDRYEQRIMNIHPALLPFFGGKGMYGRYVHEAVLKSGMKVSGCSVHYVDKGVDTGPIILQQAVPVKEADSPESLAQRISIYEHRLYPKAIQLHVDGRLRVEAGERRKVVKIDYSNDWEREWNKRQRIYLAYQKSNVYLKDQKKAMKSSVNY
jgi:phosphoribosylglycinamide formyltransferase-1